MSQPQAPQTRRRRFDPRARLLCAAAWFGISSAASAACTNLAFIDPVSDVDWDCIFPITIAGIPIDMGDHPPDDTDSSFFCSCPGTYGPEDPGLGFLVSFWEPARIVDTVADPWCFPAIGVDESGLQGPGYNGGGTLYTQAQYAAFMHYHYYLFPVWALMEMFQDVPCLSSGDSFDLAMVSEVRPDWGDDLTAMQLYPETALMGNPGVVLACIADAIAATVGYPLDALYWCMGSWGTTYPMTGNTVKQDYVEANAAAAGKAIYTLARFGMWQDRVVNYCSSTYVPIWIKSHVRLQEIDPVVDDRCHTIGEPGLSWTQQKNPVGRTDNFSWMVFRKVQCCVVVF